MENNNNVVKFINRLFESREQAHVYHLQSDTYAKHIALEEYYESLLGYIDTLSEVYMGQYDLISDFTVIEENDIDKTDVIKYFQELASFVTSERYNSFKEEDLHLQAIIDEVLVLIYKTLYKLKFLK